jgi:hypothetical protein
MENHFYIIFPDKRYVGFSKIKTWFADAVANKEVVDAFGILSSSKWDYEDYKQAALTLEEAGIITLGQKV